MDIKNTISIFDKFINSVLHTWGGKNELKRIHIGMFDEAGEIVAKEKKRLRGDDMPNFKQDVMKEIGDHLFYLRKYGHHYNLTIDEIENNNKLNFEDFQYWFCHDFYKYKSEPKKLYNELFYNVLSLINYLEYSFEEIIKMNFSKLSKRLEKGTIQGNGDNR